MTDPNKYALRLLFLLVIVGILITLLFLPLYDAFEGKMGTELHALKLKTISE